MDNYTIPKASAIYVDLENMALTGEDLALEFDVSLVMERVAAYSRPILRKVYGNWHRFTKYGPAFMEAAFELVQCFSGTSGKNGVDIQLSVDALEGLILWQHINTVFLVTGDSDYCPLVRTLRKLDRQVIGIGWLASTSKVFREHCDEFWPYDEIIKTSAVSMKLANCAKLTLLLQQVFGDLQTAEWVRMSTLKSTMLKRDSAFDEKEHGFAKFSDFVVAHPFLLTRFSEESSDYLVKYLPNGVIMQNRKPSQNGSGHGVVMATG